MWLPVLDVYVMKPYRLKMVTPRAPGGTSGTGNSVVRWMSVSGTWAKDNGVGKAFGSLCVSKTDGVRCDANPDGLPGCSRRDRIEETRLFLGVGVQPAAECLPELGSLDCVSQFVAVVAVNKRGPSRNGALVSKDLLLPVSVGAKVLGRS